MPVEADFVTEVAPKVFADVDTAAAPNALVAGAPKPEAAGAAPKEGAGAAAAPKGLAAATGVLVAPPKANEGLGGSVEALPKANGVLWVVAAGGFAAPNVNEAPPVGAAAVVVAAAGVAPNENDGGAADPKEGAAVTTAVDPNEGAAVVVDAGVEPKLNSPAAAEAVVAGAAVAPKLKGLTVATEEAVVTAAAAPKVVAVVDRAGAGAAAPNVNSPEAAAGAGASVLVDAGVAVAPKLKSLISDAVVVAVVDPNEGTVLAAAAAWPREKVGAAPAAVVVAVVVSEAPKLKLGVGRALEPPNEKTAGAAVSVGALEAAVLTTGHPKLAAPKVKGTAGAAAFSGVSLLSAGFAPKLETAGAAADVVVTAVGAAKLAGASVVTESGSVDDGKLNFGTGNPDTGAEVDLLVASVRLNVTVAGLAGAFATRSGALVVEEVLPVTVLEVDMFPRDRGVEVVVVDSGDDVAVLVAAAVTSAVSAADFDPKANGNPPPLLDS